METMPQSGGHVRVIPKEAATDLFDLSDTGLIACIRMTQQSAAAVRAALQPDGVAIMQLNGGAAGQTVAHVHFHIVPPLGGADASASCTRAYNLPY